MSNLKFCLNGKRPILKGDYYCEQCGDNWEGDETGKWAEHYFKKWETLQAQVTEMQPSFDAMAGIEDPEKREKRLKFLISRALRCVNNGSPRILHGILTEASALFPKESDQS